MMLLYHGSNVVVSEINLKKSLPYKDFGKGFYLTSIFAQAKNMARRTFRFKGGTPVVSVFEAPDNLLELNGLNTKSFVGVSEQWAQFIINNRNKHYEDVAAELCNTDCKYDVVYGPVGNDDVTFLLQQYTRGFIDEAALCKGLEFKLVSDQYSFHTDKAVECLKFVEALYV